jgi:hypothetical protein
MKVGQPSLVRSSAWLALMWLALALTAAAPAARADDAPAAAPAPDPFRLAVGWHGGNGVGLLGGGVAVIVRDRLTLELQGGYDSGTQDGWDWTGYGVAALARVSLRREGARPSLAIGVSQTWKRVQALTWSHPGVFANAGAEWRRPSGVRVLFGVGYRYSPAVKESNGSMWVDDRGYSGLNAEVSVGYVFL